MLVHKPHINNERLPKKYVKKIFRRPGKAVCKKCDGHMQRIGEAGPTDKIIFACEGNGNPAGCVNMIDLTEFKGKLHFRTDRLAKDLDRIVNTPPKQMILVIRNLRLKDKFYEIDEVFSYNPVKKLLSGRNAEYAIDDKDHAGYLEIIKTNIENAESTIKQ